MATKTQDETAAAAGQPAGDTTAENATETEAKDATAAEAAPGEGPAGEAAAGTPSGEEAAAGEDPAGEAAADDIPDAVEAPAARIPSGVGQGTGAVVAAALGVVSLSGGWLGTVASARSSLIGQLGTSQSAGVAQQIQAVYGDSWKATAVVGGIFALAALIVGALVLIRPAFGTPGPDQAPWIKSVAWAGVALGVIGLLLAAAKYSDLLLGLPSAPS